MLITKHFVLLNFPKTGSSFARKVLKVVYRRRRNEKNLFFKIFNKLKINTSPFKELFFTHYYYDKIGETIIDQHGTYSQIPGEYRDKPVVSIIRNPYERLLSIYEFKFWQQNPQLGKDIVNKHFPNFPDLSIDEYIDYLKLVNKKVNLKGKDNLVIGAFTVQFIQFFFKNPENVLLNINEEYLKSDTLFKNDLADIKFLRQENLKEDLICILKDFGFTEDEITFIREHKKVNITKKTVNHRNELYTNKLIKYFEEEEFFLIKILNELGFNYEKPSIN
jgi:hypothetical protein